MFFSQISQQPNLIKIFDEILNESGSEIYLKKATNYIQEGEKVEYADIVNSAAKMNETIIGYEDNKEGKSRLNLPKNKELIIEKGDRVIVLVQTEFS